MSDWQSVLVLVLGIGTLCATILKGVLSRLTMTGTRQIIVTLILGILCGLLAHGLGVLSPAGPDAAHYLWASLIGLLGGLVGLSAAPHDVTTVVTDLFTKGEAGS